MRVTVPGSYRRGAEERCTVHLIERKPARLPTPEPASTAAKATRASVPAIRTGSWPCNHLGLPSSPMTVRNITTHACSPRRQSRRNLVARNKACCHLWTVRLHAQHPCV